MTRTGAAGGRGSAARTIARAWREQVAFPAATALLLAACAPRPAKPLPPIRPQPHPVATIHAPLAIRAPRPDVAFPDLVPDIAEEPRWPLTGMQHPSLQPSFDVADALAEPGITWTDLCARNVDRRRDPSHRDELLYLAGWCAAVRRDPAGAVGLLAQVRSSSVPGIAHAVPLDIANILVDSQDAEHADRILVEAQIRSAQVYDMIAAAYFEIGRNDDAVQATASALQLDTAHRDSLTCHRLARATLLGPEASRSLLVAELVGAAQHKPADPVCVELAADVPCAVDPEGGCRAYNATHSIDDTVWRLAKIEEHWRDARTWDAWMDVALHIQLLQVRTQSLPMFSAAVEAAVVASECDALSLVAIENHLERILLEPLAPGATDSLAWVRSLVKAPEHCTEFRERWLAANPQ